MFPGGSEDWLPEGLTEVWRHAKELHREARSFPVD